MTCIYNYDILHSFFTALVLCALLIHSFPVPQPLASTDLFTGSLVFLSPESHIVGIIQGVAFFRLASFT